MARKLDTEWNVLPHGPLTQLADNLWWVEGDLPNMSLERCMTVIEEDLTPLQRRIFHLKHLRRQSIRSIAGALGKSEDAIKANLYRMRISISESTPGLEVVLGA